MNQLIAANSYAALGKPLPPRRSVTISPTRQDAAPALAPNQARNLPWIVPAAQVRWLGPGISFYTPQRIEQLFRQALAGDLQSQWEMFDLMEATWPRLSKNLNQLKDDVISNGFKIQPFKAKGREPTPEAVERAELVEEILFCMEPEADKDENDFEDTLRDALDARGKGISVLEADWEMREISSGQAVGPRCTRWVHPAWYGYEFGPADSTLKLKVGPFSTYMSTVTSEARQWMDFPDGKFIVAVCKNKTGHPLGSAMLHVLGFWWAASNFTAEWFLNFCQMFGQPIRWATYAATMTPGDQASLATALTNMGSQAWAMFPEGTQFELKEAMAKGSDNVQKAMLDFADKQADLLILRQTLTSDVSQEGGARAQGEVHERVLGSVEFSLAKWLCKTMQPLVRTICEQNYGDGSEYPTMVPTTDDEEDPDTLAGTLVKVDQAGLELTDEAIPEISQRLGFAVQRKAQPEIPPGDGLPGAPNGKNGFAARHAGAIQHPVDEMAAKRAEALAEAFKGRYAPVRQIILSSASAAEAQKKLAELFPEMKPGRAAAIIEEGMQIAAAHGAAEAVKEKAS